VTDYTDLQRDLDRIGDNFGKTVAAQLRFNDTSMDDSRAQWDSIAELRDEINAVANRLENLTAFVTSNPAEVAARIVTDANRGTLRSVHDDG